MTENELIHKMDLILELLDLQARHTGIMQQAASEVRDEIAESALRNRRLQEEINHLEREFAILNQRYHELMDENAILCDHANRRAEALKRVEQENHELRQSLEEAVNRIRSMEEGNP